MQQIGSRVLQAASRPDDTRTVRDVSRTPLLAGCLLTLMAAMASACASGEAIGSGPAPFPGAPARTWTRAVDTERAARMHDVIETAVALRGARYQLGGVTPQGGFDCSGFVRYVFALYQVTVPRTVADQYRTGQEVAREHVSAGDLVFFSTTGPGATHVGIVVDPVGHTFVHAPGTGSVVRVERFDTPYWRNRMLGARRLTAVPRPAV
jgi:cell wall-associated NlpC family hydrolase